MALFTPPRSGEDVSILARNARLRGHVTARDGESLTVELERTPIRRPFHFHAGTAVDVEWVNGHGVMQMAVTVAGLREEPAPTLDLVFAGSPEPVTERRAAERHPLELAASAWSPARPTARFEGTTVDLSTGGALLRLPGLPPFAATVELRIGLPQRPLSVSAAVRWRKEPDLVGVQFQRIEPHEAERLVEFLRSR